MPRQTKKDKLTLKGNWLNQARALIDRIQLTSRNNAFGQLTRTTVAPSRSKHLVDMHARLVGHRI